MYNLNEIHCVILEVNRQMSGQARPPHCALILLALVRNIRLRTQNVRSLYRSDSLETVSDELAKYNLDLVADGLRVVVSQQTIIHFSMEMRMHRHLGTGVFVHKGII
jgi:hypothetical protein